MRSINFKEDNKDLRKIIFSAKDWTLVKIMLLFFSINTIVTTAQQIPATDKMNYYNLGKKLYTEVHFLPDESKDSIKAITLFRFTFDLISFEKAGLSNKTVNSFYSIPKLEVEFKDSEGIIRHRELWQDTIYSDNFEQTISKQNFIYGAIECKLSMNNYDIDIRLSDKNNQNIRKIAIKDSFNLFDNKSVIGKPIFVELVQNDIRKYKPFILKNNIEFSSISSAILVPVSYNNEFSKFNYSCKFIEPAKMNEIVWKSNYDINGVIIPQKNYVIKISKNEITGIELTTSNLISSTMPLDAIPDKQINELNSSDKKLLNGILQIELPLEDIVPGKYELKISESESTDTMTYNFEVVWEDMPVILQRPRFAIESMFYILTDDEYKKMLDVKEKHYSDEIINYWKKEDPSQFTPFNESMAEYFKRVDYAMFNFRTLNEANGVKTDRGKIFILYGPASGTENSLKDNKAFEIWKYEHLKKMFVFETMANDVFKLIDIREY